MRVVLKDYQSDAVKAILKALSRSGSDWHDHQERSAFALSAPTSSGKTVIAAAAIEAVLHGSDEFDVEPDPSAVFLWVSKEPALNEQTRSRFIQHADRIPIGDLVVLDKDFAEESLQAGTVYFINPQKLAVTSGFVKYTDTRSVTFWDILANTINDPGKTLYMVLDEAHEGMKKQSSGEQTIVQRIINGNGVPGVPVVWGISATIERFTTAMAKATKRGTRPNIEVDPKDVQASGLIKTAIHLDLPDEVGEFSTALLRDATLDFVDVCKRWDAYTDDQGIDERVEPLLVVQIPNKAAGESDTAKGRKDEEELILRVLTTIREHWPQMPSDGIAHVLGESRGAITVGGFVIPRIEPQLVQGERHIRVLIAKDAISTGWDCPRAEVLVSLRPGNDPTYVTQLIGRMVRTPLADSTSVDRLNTAAAYLPKFDASTTRAVVDKLLGKSKDADKGSSTALVQKVLLKPTTLTRNQHIPVDVVDAIEALPSYARPSTIARPIKRLLKAAQAFGQDNLVPEANQTAHKTLYGVLDGYASDFEQEIAEQAQQVRTADIRRIRADLVEHTTDELTEQRDADAGTVEDAMRHLRRILTTSIVQGYLSREVESAIKDAEAEGGSLLDVDLLGIQARVAAIGLFDTGEKDTVASAVERAADNLTRHWLDAHAGEIKKLSDSRRAVYEDLRGMAREPELAPIEIQTEEQVDTVDADLVALPKAKRHVLADEHGDYPLPASLNRWENAVIAHELKDDSVLGWYRNPSTATSHSLRITYDASGTWRSVQPDLVFVAEGDDGLLRASIIDPHGAHLGDAHPKLKALALYADEHGSKFERIVAIGMEKDDHLIGLDLLDPKVRAAVYGSPADNDSIKALFNAHGKKYAAVS